MTDRTAATAGFVLAGVALAASLGGWQRPGVVGRAELAVLAGIALTALALVAFALRRSGRLAPRLGAPVAGLAGFGAAVATGVGYALAGTWSDWSGVEQLVAAAAVAAGVAAAIAAYADWRGMERAALIERLQVALVGSFVGVAGILMLVVWQLVLGGIVYAVAPQGVSPQVATLLGTVALGGGTLTVAAAYLYLSDRDVSFIDLRWPTLRHLGYVVAGVVGVLGANIAIGLLLRELGAQSATHSVIETAESTGQPAILLLLAPLSYLVIAPGEELLYRNVVQKAIRESFSPVAGVVLASVIFAAVHLPAYSSQGASLQATLNTLGIVFALALVLGAVYELTGNVVVPILVHGTFNALAFLASYAQLVGMGG